MYFFTENEVRKMLVTFEQENNNLKLENAQLKASGSSQKKKVNNFFKRTFYKINF